MVLSFRFWLRVDKKVAAIRRNGRKDFQTEEPKEYFVVMDSISCKFFWLEDSLPGFPDRNTCDHVTCDHVPCDLVYENINPKKDKVRRSHKKNRKENLVVPFNESPN